MVTEESDLRMPVVAAATWVGCLAVLAVPWWVVATTCLAVTLGLVARRPDVARIAVMVAVPLVSAAAVASLQASDVRASPVTGLAEERVTATLTLEVTGDPRVVPGRFAESVVVRARTVSGTARGTTYTWTEPIVVLGGAEWRRVPLGSTVTAVGRLAPAADHDVAALFLARDEPRVEAGPGPAWRLAATVRSGIREAVDHRPGAERVLVPALVVGDDAGLDPEVADDFRATGLTHLLAVSGTNLTLILGFLLVLARWAGLRGRALTCVGAVGIVGFVMLARTEPSVVRAAAMGTVGLLSLGNDGRRRGPRALGVAVACLLLVDPWLATTAGFALSVLATAGLIFLAPRWRDSLAGWMPRWAAEAISVPAAASLACTPLVAALSGQVSLVTVVTNLLASPAVGPATVLGLAGGLLHLLWQPLGVLVGTCAALCVGWIVTVADRGAALPAAAVDWSTTPASLALLTGLCAGLAWIAPRALRRRGLAIASAGLLGAAVALGPPTPGWPPRDWVLAVCDVGQGDAVVLNAGAGAAVVVDVGPDPASVDRCLRRLEVEQVPLLVLTHFHADHVDGLEGVLAGRPVHAAETTVLADPADTAASVTTRLGAHGVRAVAAPYGQTRRVGDVRLQTVWPLPGTRVTGPGDGSAANDASVVLVAEVSGVRILLPGDLEPPGQAALRRTLPSLSVDVLKVPHHGSRHQDLDLLLGLGADLALVSVGEDNDYGHPAPDLLAALEATGATVLRTDRSGDLLVLPGDDGLVRVVTDA